ncbi:MAG: hypothetical protein QNK37_01795 [Acidobacteriota bacterium]|nr:hypothetical protein [Acidobacteriota bacterium]
MAGFIGFDGEIASLKEIEEWLIERQKAGEQEHNFVAALRATPSSSKVGPSL